VAEAKAEEDARARKEAAAREKAEAKAREREAKAQEAREREAAAKARAEAKAAAEAKARADATAAAEANAREEAREAERLAATMAEEQRCAADDADRDAAVVEVLAGLGLTDLLSLFREQEVDDDAFGSLEAGDLREMGIAPEAVTRILSARDGPDEDAIPEDLLCPISCALMKDPVSADDGETYERACIEAWFAKGKRTSPATNEPLDTLKLRPNLVVRRLTASFLDGRLAKG